jgi:Fe-S oxidoreductase
MAKEKKPVDLLWYVECHYSYHQRGKDAAVALARILDALGADFGILGHEEKCAGEDMRLGGEKGLFELLAEQNIAAMGKYQFQKLLVTDPHAFNAFKHFYPALGGDYDVIHYSQYLAPKMEGLSLPQKIAKRVTFHDPCYLGRHNGEYEAPRQVLRAIPGLELVEMERNRENSACCGGGGGGMYLDGYLATFQKERLSEVRVKEAVATGAEIMVVACPYEVSRFEDAVKSTGNEGKLQVLDLAEIVAKAMGLLDN